MQSDLIQFGAVAASQAKRSAVGFAQPIRSRRDTASTSVLDEVFADFTRVDAGSPSNMAINQSVQQKFPSLSQPLASSIATQLEAIDSQRCQLARLLETV